MGEYRAGEGKVITKVTRTRRLPAPPLRILVGDCRDTLKTLADDCVDCVVTSPPYFALRDYGVDGQIGREHTLQEYIQSIVDVFREVRRVLKPTGTCWLNIGDCYAATAKKPQNRDKQDQKTYAMTRGKGVSSFLPEGMKPKDLMMVPNRVAIALQEDGWYVRSEIIWAKKGGGMPESVKDRPSCSHEKIWLLTKKPRGYFYDYEVSAMPAADTLDVALKKISRKGEARDYTNQAEGAGRNDADIFERERARLTKQDQVGNRTYTGFNARWKEAEAKRRRVRRADAKMADVPGRSTHSLHKPGAHEFEGLTRRLRNHERAVEVEVWEMGTASFPGSHFAVFPKALVERCLKAGCPEGGLVLDPFGGAGTTGLVARLTGRRSILCELNAEYADLARRRVESGGALDTEMRRQARRNI